MATETVLLRRFFCGLVLACTAGLAGAQTWPVRPIRFVLPFAAGGSGDTFARPLAAMLGEALGQPILIENVAGAGGEMGAEQASKAAPDGYTFLMISNGHPIGETMYPRRKYRLLGDFVPVTELASISLALVVNPAVPAKNTAELIALMKAQPGRFSYASSGVGTIYHLPMELFKSMAGVDILHIPYKSSAAARADVVGGQVQMMMDSLAAMGPFIKSGQVRALGVGAAKRDEAFPNLPTISESGLKDFTADTWLGFMAPKGTPPAIVDRLQQEIAKIVARPEVAAFYRSNGAVPVASRPEAFGLVIRAETAKWKKVIEEAGIKAE
ncbi:MAG: tripartite tricarboxylate transporter substrate binding protein [Pseudomonadota bacterium]